MTVEISGFSVIITKKRIKNLYLRVLPDGGAEVSAPLGMPDGEIIRFIESKSGWLLKQQKRLAALPQRTAKWESGELLPVFGKSYTLQTESGGRSYSLILDGGLARLRLRQGCTAEQAEAFVNSWYGELLREKLAELLPRWEGVTGLRCSELRIKNMKSRWGSCNPRSGEINLNLQLAKYQPECLEYVVLHELAHLNIPGHGADFKAYLDVYMPYWRQRRDLLNGK